MPKISQQEASDILSQPASSTQTFREKLMERFKATDWVIVKNIDDQDFQWAYMPAENETFQQVSASQRETYRDAPDYYSLAAGQQEALIGENAYMMIEGLYKRLASKTVIKAKGDFIPGVTAARNFNWADGGLQEKYISQIYQGKTTPSFNITPAEPVKLTPQQQVAKDLGLTNAAQKV